MLMCFQWEKRAEFFNIISEKDSWNAKENRQNKGDQMREKMYKNKMPVIQQR